MTSSLDPIVRHIKPAHQRSAVGIDLLTISPTDSRGNNYCVVIVNLFTKLTQIYPAKDATAVSLAQCIFQFTTTYGLVDEIHSDSRHSFQEEPQTQRNKQTMSCTGAHSVLIGHVAKQEQLISSDKFSTNKLNYVMKQCNINYLIKRVLTSTKID